jgi:hypothetical protein
MYLVHADIVLSIASRGELSGHYRRGKEKMFLQIEEMI